MIRTVDLADADADAAAPGDGAVVVVDVLRAATTAAVALAARAALIPPVRTVQEAFAARGADRCALLLGEVDGAPIPGFDLRGEEPEGVAGAGVGASHAARRFPNLADPVMPAAGLELCAQVDLLDVVVVARPKGGARPARGASAVLLMGDSNTCPQMC